MDRDRFWRDLGRVRLDAIDPAGVGDRQFREWCKRQDAPGWPPLFRLFLPIRKARR